jgi:hypothetical protein
LVLLALATGCGEHRSSGRALSEPGSRAGALLSPRPDATNGVSSAGVFSHMPLAVGNQWERRVWIQVRLRQAGEPEIVSTNEYDLRMSILDRQVFEGEPIFIVVEHDVTVTPEPWTRYGLREDANGLYFRTALAPVPGIAADAEARSGQAGRSAFEARVRAATAGSPLREEFAAAAARLVARAGSAGQSITGLPGFVPPPGLPRPGEPGGLRTASPLPGENVQLAYPLIRGSRWRLGSAANVARIVERRERVTVPAGEFQAWVVRGLSPFYGPDEYIRLWYAREGLVRAESHHVEVVRDRYGIVVGSLTTDMRQSLTGYQLASPVAHR